MESLVSLLTMVGFGIFFVVVVCVMVSLGMQRDAQRARDEQAAEDRLGEEQPDDVGAESR